MSPSAGEFTFEIDVNSIDSNDAKRDEHLRGPDFFDAAKYPKMIFKSTKVSQSPNGLQITGDMTLHGVTKQIVLPVKYVGEGMGPFGKYRCGFYSQFVIKRSEFEMNNMLPNIGDEISVTFSFEGIRN